VASRKGRTSPTPRTPRAERAGRPATDVRGVPGATDRDDTADPEARARQICLRLLTLAPRTRAQLASALRDRGVPDDAAHTVLDRFADVGLIDDAAFARAWVESRHYSRGLAGRALRAELRQRGVGDDQIKDAIEDLGPDAEVATARRIVERKLAGTRGLPPEARIRRLAGTLARKGYPPGLAFRVVREALETEGAEVEESCFGDLDTYTE
jgi:regulatory protein